MLFADFYHNVNTPVIVCTDDCHKTIVYENRTAVMQFNPLAKDQDWSYLEQNAPLCSLLKLPQGEWDTFFTSLEEANGNLGSFQTVIELYTGETVAATLAANRLEISGILYIVIHVQTIQAEQISPTNAQAIVSALELVYKEESTEEAINKLLAYAGDYVSASRTYIFEPVSSTNISNTYEWCAPGIAPAQEQLQKIPMNLYFYNHILEKGLTVTDNIQKLSPKDRSILEMQGIKSIAILPLNSRGAHLGFVGFDDCLQYRQWSFDEIDFLQHLCDVLALRLIRRNSERNMEYSLKVLNIVTDNTANMIFVVDQTGKFLFANNAVGHALDVPADALVGQNAEAIFSHWAGDDSTDRFQMLVGDMGLSKDHTYNWEFYNPQNEQWYLVRCSVVDWMDHSNVHLLHLTEITGQKEKEARLKHAASIDTMTGLYNRAQARRLITKIMKKKDMRQRNCVVFIDLNSLKTINDSYGHAVGDDMILQTIDIIQSRIRKTDVLCRWGGDEFLLIVNANEEQTHALIRDVLVLVEEHNATGQSVYSVSFSYGVAKIDPFSTKTVDDIIQEADAKMYEYKTKYRL